MNNNFLLVNAPNLEDFFKAIVLAVGEKVFYARGVNTESVDIAKDIAIRYKQEPNSRNTEALSFGKLFPLDPKVMCTGDSIRIGTSPYLLIHIGDSLLINHEGMFVKKDNPSSDGEYIIAFLH